MPGRCGRCLYTICSADRGAQPQGACESRLLDGAIVLAAGSQPGKLIVGSRARAMSGTETVGQGASTVYHRDRTRIQTVALDQLMIASGEACGKNAWGSNLPTVQAYWGPLAPGTPGIEFETTISPQNGSCTPSMAYWYATTPGVTTKPSGIVCIPIVVRKSVP